MLGERIYKTSGGYCGLPKLFNDNLLKAQIKNYYIDNYDEKVEVIQGWKRNLETIRGVSEKSLQAAFLKGIFGTILGYKEAPEAVDNEWTLFIEKTTEVDQTSPDATLGFYSQEYQNTQAVVELKSPGASLDKKQYRQSKEYGSPVDQAFSYLSKYDGCKWIIVSNMLEIRLYKVGRSQDYYEEFSLEGLDREEELKKFHLLLASDNLIGKDGESFTETLSERTKIREQDISVKFYNLYNDVRIRLFEELQSNNPSSDKTELIEKAQKFLDRIIFICFCEDMGLLPYDLLHQAIERGKESFSENGVWNEIKGVFNALDKGSQHHNITAYDGGLFEPDNILNNLVIPNDFFDAIYEISEYDFGTDLDVNILGHIFEQSISDIEALKADVQAGEYDPQNSRRRQEGIYYTPNYITSYIVENSLGRYLEEIKKELGEESLPSFEKLEQVSDKTKKEYRKKLVDFYTAYEERLRQIKVLDPACGSGAFLNQAFDFLFSEYRWIHEQLSRVREGQMTVFDTAAYQRSVLKENLYGVDINEESVEITKLSLWLKIANSREQLPVLNENIKCGDSLIDDSEESEKAFDWHEEFSEIMAEGGFDIVIGNPPYVRILDDKEYYGSNYETFSCGDLYALFIERGIGLLKNKGYFSYIVPSLFLRGIAYEPLRRFILEYGDDIKIKEWGDGVFENVQMPTSTIVIKKDLENTGLKWEGLLPNADILEKIERDAFTLDNLVKIKRGMEIGKDKLLKEGDYIILAGEDISRYYYLINKYVTQDTYIKYKKEKEYFSGPRILIRETGSRITSIFLEKPLLHTRTLYSIKLISERISYLYLLGVINSSLMQAYYRMKYTAETNIFPKIRIAQVRQLPIKIVPWKDQVLLANMAEKIINACNKLHYKMEIRFYDLIVRYTSGRGKTLDDILKNTLFSNKVYDGRRKTLQPLKVTIDEEVITISDKEELVKLEVKDDIRRMYLKIYFESFTKCQVNEINQIEGNVLDKLLQVEVPDYDKLEVINKVVDEWNNLQQLIQELEDEIEKTDKEIDNMVYELYELTDEEIQTVEENLK